MHFLALWSSYQESELTQNLSKADLLASYQRTHDGRYLVALLERVDQSALILSRIVVKYIRKAEDREDFIQELYVKLCKTLKTAQPHTNLDNWIKMIVRNACLNFLNRADNRRQSQELDSIAENNHATTDVTKIEAGLDLQSMLSKIKASLNDKQWSCIEKRFVEGKGHQACAKELALSPTQFRGVLTRAVEKLRKEYGEEFWNYIKN